MDMLQKITYVESDFRNMVIGELGVMPDDKDAAIDWYGKYMALENAWCEKWKDNSLGRYAFRIAALFNDRCEYIYKDKFGSYGNVDYRRKVGAKVG